MKILLVLVSLTAFIATTHQRVTKRQAAPNSGGGGDGNSKRIVCYYTSWSSYREVARFVPQNINPYLCTHLVYAFSVPDLDENTIKIFDPFQDITRGGYKDFTDLKMLNPNLKTMLSIGGWNEGSARFSPLAADPVRRANFVKTAIAFLRQYEFDGLDIAWQYPAFRTGGTPQDKENYARLVEEMRREIIKESNETGNAPLLLSVAMSGQVEYIEKGYDIPTLNENLDFINLVAYDYHLSSGPNVQHHSPLYPVREEFDNLIYSQLNGDASIRNLLSHGMLPEKVNFGIPSYGRIYNLESPDETEPGSPPVLPVAGVSVEEPGYLPYYSICQKVTGNGWTVKHQNRTAVGPYAYNVNQSTWIGYDDPESARMKAEYARRQGLGGVMFWTVDDDDFRGVCHGVSYPIITAAKEAFLGETQTMRPQTPPVVQPGDTPEPVSQEPVTRQSVTQEPVTRQSVTQEPTI